MLLKLIHRHAMLDQVLITCRPDCACKEVPVDRLPFTAWRHSEKWLPTISCECARTRWYKGRIWIVTFVLLTFIVNYIHIHILAVEKMSEASRHSERFVNGKDKDELVRSIHDVPVTEERKPFMSANGSQIEHAGVCLCFQVCSLAVDMSRYCPCEYRPISRISPRHHTKRLGDEAFPPNSPTTTLRLFWSRSWRRRLAAWYVRRLLPPWIRLDPIYRRSLCHPRKLLIPHLPWVAPWSFLSRFSQERSQRQAWQWYRYIRCWRALSAAKVWRHFRKICRWTRLFDNLGREQCTQRATMHCWSDWMGWCIFRM